MKSFLRTGVSVVLPALCWLAPAVAQDQPPAAQQPPPAQQQTEQPRTGVVQNPPEIPKIPDVRQPGETGWWLGVMAWFPAQNPTINKGREAAFDTLSLARFQGKPKYARGADLGIAMGLHNALRFSYFDTRATGDFTAGSDLRLWDQTYQKDTLITTDYRLQHGKISFDYLTWPYPVGSRRFRLKTLWQFQYTNIRAGFDAPKLPIADENGLPLVDASGNPISYGVTNNRWFMGPELGVGATYYAGRHFRFDANAAGFAWPRRNSIWDADASANIRYGKWEFRVGAKGFHFKTSTQQEFFMRGTIYQGFVGFRWYSD